MNNNTIVLRSTEQTVDGHWRVNDPAIRKLSALDRQSALLKEGDLLITKSSGSSLHIGKTNLVTREIADLGCCFSNFMQRITPSNTMSPKFLWYFMNCHTSRAQLDYMSNTTTGLANLNGGMIGDLVIGMPEKKEQEVIVSFLDRKTALIDNLIAKREHQIELLQEQRTALISRTVTKGLNPDVPKKDSGVEWMGEIPAHWDVQSNRALFQERIESGVLGLPVLKVSLHSGVTEGEDDDDDSSRVRKMMDDKTAYKRAYAGDIAYNMMRAWQGAIGAVPVDGLVSPAYVVAKPTEGVESRYFEGLFRTSWYKKDFERYSYGIASFRWRLYWDQFKVLRSPVPPLNEQRAIADHIDRETDKIDTFVAKVQQSVEKLREYRQSLISAAVTGKIDVRNIKLEECSYKEIVNTT